MPTFQTKKALTTAVMARIGTQFFTSSLSVCTEVTFSETHILFTIHFFTCL